MVRGSVARVPERSRARNPGAESAVAVGMAARYRRWFAYEEDSHRKVLAAFAAAPKRARATRQFRKAMELAGHIVAARQIWLFRLGAARRAPSEFFPTGLSLPELSRRFARMHAAWSAYLSSATEREIHRSFEYLSTEGVRYRNSVEDVLTQLYGHSLYHRGQIAMLLRSAGAEPAETDFIFWTREPVIPGKQG
jgi:uncharacterized damage-inducible protein DinB